MEPSFASIQALVSVIKRDGMLSSTFTNGHFPSSFVSPSAYETAWLAMIPNPKDPQSKRTPMFRGCLDWILHNQKEGGFWGEEDEEGFPAIDALPSTIACIIVLDMWAVGDQNVTKGWNFIHGNFGKLLLRAKDYSHRSFPRWLTIVLPATIELARSRGLKFEYNLAFSELVSELFFQRQQILAKEDLVDKHHNFPLLSYLEALPASYRINEQDITMNLSEDGSLFQSPSATAMAFMVTGNKKCLKYLELVVKESDNGVPAMYPLDEELIQLHMINQIQRLGLAEHFGEEIQRILGTIHKSYKTHELRGETIDFIPINIYKDSLAFRLLRMHGYDVTPDKFCWFVYDQDILSHVEMYHGKYTSVLYQIYRSSDLMFPKEHELEKARAYSMRLLKKCVSLVYDDDNLVVFPNLKLAITRELNVPWMARVDHLDHRFWIEDNMIRTLWVGKASYFRMLPLQNEKLMQLAVRNYEFRQSVYRKELEELKRWSKDWGLASMGFGREKTVYCYFSIASATSLPHDSIVRMIVAKSAIAVTVADDFFDSEGSLDELQTLTQAFQRWNGNNLTSHSKKIFDVIDHLVTDISTKIRRGRGRNAMENLREMWRVAFASWMKEATWSKMGYVPSMDEYFETGKKSIAIDTMILPATCFLSPSYPISMLKPAYYEPITKLLMGATRLLNDVQSYQKEVEEGKKNFVLLYLEENANASVEESIAYVKEMMDGMKKELLKHALLDGGGSCELPKTCRRFHLSCLRIFQMFYNSGNVFDSVSDLAEDINRAIYVPLSSKTRYFPK